MRLTKAQVAELAQMARKMDSMAAEMNQVAGRVKTPVQASVSDALRYEITSIKHLAGEVTLRVVGDGEVPQQLEAGQIVTLRKATL